MSAGFIECQPLTFNDFSGGETDHVLQGDVKRYERAQNFLITVDKKLETRPGTVIYDQSQYLLGASTTRIAGLYTSISESVLLAHTSRDLYTQVPDSGYGNPWTRILGPTGNEAIPGGSVYNQLSTGEFQRQLYYTADSGTLPGHAFRDQNGTWKALTAGMPKMQFVPNYPTDTSLLNACITLANALRTSMIAHFNDQSNGVQPTTFQHKKQDKWSLSYFQAVTFTVFDTEFPGPTPAPTPAVNATDATSLYLLCVALSLAYEHHRNDLAGVPPSNSGSRAYHLDILYQPDVSGGGGFIPNNLGINQKLTLSGIVTSPQKAAAFLDELAQKWYWHQVSPFSHSDNNDYSVMSRNFITAPKVGTIYSSKNTLQVTPNYVDFMSFAYWIKKAWNNHVNGTDQTGGFMHGQTDQYGPITLPTPFDFDSAAAVIFWARYLYGQIHLLDSNYPVHTRVTFTSTTGSASLTAIVTTSTGAARTITIGDWILTSTDYFNDSNVHNRRAARVIATGAGVATVSRTVITGAAGTIGQDSASWLHGAYVNAGLSTAASDVTNQRAGTAEYLSSFSAVGTDLTTWINLGSEFLIAFGTHQNNAATHKNSNFLGGEMIFDTGVGATFPPNNNLFFVPTPVSYGYAAFYRYLYTVEQNGLQYIDQGAPVFSNSIITMPSYPVGTILPSFNTTFFNTTTISTENPSATLIGIPTLINTSLTNYDTTISVVPQTTDTTQSSFYQNLTIELYRTINGGTTFYFVDQIANVVSNVSQNYSDATNENSPRPGDVALNLRKVIYTSGGVVANDQPPVSKYTVSLNNFMYYGAITDTGQFFPQRIRQSLQGAPDSAPATFFDDMDDELVGLGSARNNLIAICKNSVFRVTGSFTSTGQGSMTHDRIGDTLGGLNARSIVKTEIGLFFAGTDGFYYTDGFQLIKISLDLDKTYQKFTKSDIQKQRIFGAYDKLTRRIWWAMQSTETGQDNDLFFVFYLDYGVKPSGVFTRVLTTLSWMPSSVCFFKGRLIIGDTRGYLFKTEPDSKSDPMIDLTTLDATKWKKTYIPWDFRICALDFGTTFKRKWITRVHAVGANVGNASIQLLSINDNNDTTQGPGIQNLPPIQYVANPMWGAPGVIWGTSTYNWKYDGKMDLWRRFPARSMRSDFKQIAYTPGNFVVYRYDDWPQFAFATVAGTVASLITPAGYTLLKWPSDVVGMSISFDNDNYVAQFPITFWSATSNSHRLTFSDPSGSGAAAQGVRKWQIQGIRIEQRLRISSFDVHFATLGDENQNANGVSDPTGFGANS